MKPNKRELEVLQQFCGAPEPWGRFAGAGEITKQSLIAKGWIRLNTDPNYDPSDYQITPLGEDAADC
jgi:hypothetical protein